MSKHDLIPAYYDGQDRTGRPLFLKSREEIKTLRKTGELQGSYQMNGNVFVVYGARRTELESLEHLIAAGNMSDAWKPKQSGFGGPFVLQMVTERLQVG